MKKKAIYAGSFDPVTNGHLWLIDKAANLFDELIVAIGDNPNKSYYFSLAARERMLRDLLGKYKNIRISSFSGEFLVHYADDVNVNYIVRGIRNNTDFDFEKMLHSINSDISSDIETVYFIPPIELSEISSSLVKGFIGTKRWQEVVAKYVPETVVNSFIKELESK
ncbi:MAG: pantetheine-phosphate adenylyltransferase [Burkholderiales bacterium]|nr:pantetheine-phosphate adenylyltransferase [Burkholderiales bacterium]